jgi:hypothetical protein
MTPPVAKYFEQLDACIAAGGVLEEMARAMADTVLTGGTLQFNAAGVEKRWRIEARRELRRRAAASVQLPSGKRSEGARELNASLMRYAAGGAYERDKRAGSVPAGKNTDLFAILQGTGGRVPKVRTLRRRLGQIGPI